MINKDVLCGAGRGREEEAEVNLPAAHSRRPQALQAAVTCSVSWPVASTAKRKGLVPLLCAQHCPVQLGGGGVGVVSTQPHSGIAGGNLKDPTPSPQPQGFPLTKLGACGTKSFF